MDELTAKAKKTGSGFDEAAASAKKLADTQGQIGKLTNVLDNTNAKIDLQRKRLADLKRAYDETFNDKDRDKLRTQIVQTEGALLSLEKTSDATAKKIWELEDSLNSAGDGAEKMSGKMESSVSKLGVAYGVVAAAMTAIIAKSVDTAAAFESSMARVQAMSSATAAEFKRLEDQAISLGVSTVFSSSQVAEGQAFLAVAGFKANDIIAAMPGLLDLAAAAQMDLGRAADITSNILTGFRLEAEQTGRVSDVLAKAFTSSNTSMEQLGYAMKYAAPIAASLGISIEETASAVGILSNAGIQGEMAGTQLRVMLLRLVNPVGDAEKVIEQLGIKTADASGKILPFSDILRQLQTAMSGLTQSAQAEAAALIAGTEAASGFLTLVSVGADELERFTGELENSGGTAQQIAEIQMDTYNGALEEMRSALEGVGIAIGDDFKPAMREAAEEITRMLLGIAEMDDGSRAFIVTMLAVGSGVGVLTTGIYGMIIALKALSAAGKVSLVSLGWIAGIAAVVGMAAGAFVSYKVNVEQAAAAQRELNELIEKSPMNRTAGEVQEMRDKAAELNDVLKERETVEKRLIKLREEFARQQSEAAGGFVAPSKELTEASKELDRLNKALQEYGFTTEQAAAKVRELNAAVEKSVPALFELTKAERSELDVKLAKISATKDLRSEYDELTKAEKLSEVQSARLTEVVRQLAEQYPQLNQYIDDEQRLRTDGLTVLDEAVGAEERYYGRKADLMKENLRNMRETAVAEKALIDARVASLKEFADVAKQAPANLPPAARMAARTTARLATDDAAKEQNKADLLALAIADIDAAIAGTAISSGKPPLSTGTGTLDLGGGSSGKSEKQQTTPEQLAQTAYRAALQMLEKRRLLGTLTEQQEADTLGRLAKQYEKYDDIWIDAESRRQRVVSQMAAASAKSAEETARASEVAQRASYDKSAEWIEMETRRMTERGESERDITEMTLEAWTRVRNRYGKDTEYFKRADKAMYDARMSLRRQDEASAKALADDAEKAAKATTKSVLDNIDAQRKAELAALDERKKAVQKYYDDILRIIDESERGRERQSIEAEAAKYRNATSEQGKKRYAELQEQLRKMDVEDNRRALQDERDDKLAALDQQKHDIDAWYGDLKTAAESFNGDMITLYQLTEDERLKAFVSTNAEIKAEMLRFQTEMAAITAKQSAAASVTDPLKASTIAQMKANAAAWHTATPEVKALLSADNQRLGTSIGANYDGSSGKWFGSDGASLFHTGRDGLTGRTFNAGNMLMPDEITAILRRDEYVFTPGQLRSLIDGAGSGGGTNVTIERIVGVEMNDTTLEDEIDVRAIGRVGVDMATEMARNNFTGGA
ncbi:phage tail tape measure protein [Paenibacillus sp. PAMC21692]|uniref:phage tail tape measure protein n=1 Tax=Paenibacillus sp. PAMC21692 TaxID=2762320 RepID=UPI00164D1BD2|nr:phage tail tape measure protein [Paenibacillus sp. PAMC21692]QNK54568.1 phage tail tape measure protein [Paenibacillus sp. PAMC21692]